MAGEACGTQDLQMLVGEQLGYVCFVISPPPEPAKLEMAGCYTQVLQCLPPFAYGWPV